jgi:hypothetical protein
MFFHQRFVPGLAIYSYLVGNEKTKEAVVIDPTRDVDELCVWPNAKGCTSSMFSKLTSMPTSSAAAAVESPPQR